MELLKLLEKRNRAYFSKMRGLSKQEIRRRIKICTELESDLIGLFRSMESEFRKSFDDFLSNYGDFSDNLNIIYNRASAAALKINTPFSRQFDSRELERFQKLLPVTERRLRKYQKMENDEEILFASAWLFSVKRAERDARSITNSLCNCERFEELKRRGYKYKVWNTRMDGKERLTHAVMNGRKVPINEPFIVGGYRMMFPGDITYNPPIKEVINCRCIMTAV